MAVATGRRSCDHDDRVLDHSARSATLLVQGEWFACDYPERPFDPDLTVFNSECYACRLALRAACHNGFGSVERANNGSGRTITLLELSAAWGTT